MYDWKAHQNADDYTVGDFLGAGTFSRVYKGVSKADGTAVAIKQLVGVAVEDAKINRELSIM